MLGLRGQRNLETNTEASTVLDAIGGEENPLLHKPVNHLRSDDEIN